MVDCYSFYFLDKLNNEERLNVIHKKVKMIKYNPYKIKFNNHNIHELYSIIYLDDDLYDKNLIDNIENTFLKSKLNSIFTISSVKDNICSYLDVHYILSYGLPMTVNNYEYLFKKHNYSIEDVKYMIQNVLMQSHNYDGRDQPLYEHIENYLLNLNFNNKNNKNDEELIFLIHVYNIYFQYYTIIGYHYGEPIYDRTLYCRI